jgi:hypothetical protein
VAICESARGFWDTEIEFKKKPARIRRKSPFHLASKFTAFKLAVLVERTLKGIEALSIFLDYLYRSGSTVDRLLQNPNARFRVLPA